MVRQKPDGAAVVAIIIRWIAGLVLAGIVHTMPAMAADEPEMSDTEAVAALTIYDSICRPLPPKVRAARDRTLAGMNKKDRDFIEGLVKTSGILLWLARSQQNRAGWCAAFDFAEDWD